jgi:hypothetical protein
MIEGILVLVVANTILLLIMALDNITVTANLKNSTKSLDALTLLQIELITAIVEKTKTKGIKVIRKKN